MKIAFYGAAHEVTGSCTVLYANGKTIMIDCGLEQGPDIYENCELPILPSSIDCVLLTHAHIDHSGKLPFLTAGGFGGKIYATEATEKLCGIMLLDSAYIQEYEAKWKNRKAKRSGQESFTPLYTVKDAEKTLKQFVSCSYDKEYTLFDGITVSFTDAGHLLGSSSVSICINENGKEETIVFSGDLGNVKRPLMRDPRSPKKADYAVIESTYGDRTHPPVKDYVKQMAAIIQSTLDRGGNLVIPCFAVGRTQEMLYLIRTIKEQGLIKRHDGFPVYVDSPLAVEATEIYSSDLNDYFDEEALELLSRCINPIKFKDLILSVSAEESVAINKDKTPKIILSASGMCEAGRIRHHLKHNLWRRESTVLFVGYQADGTLGRLILDGACRIKLFGEDIQVNAKIERLDGVSGHADRNMLIDWLKGFEQAPKTVFVNHGQDSVCDSFADDITKTLGITSYAPYNGAEFDTETCEFSDVGNTTRIVKTVQKNTKRQSTAYPQLQNAINRLTAIAEGYRNGANKDIARLTSQINSLCEKWDK